MATGRPSASRANLAASKVMWSNRVSVPMTEPEQSQGICTQNSVQEWLTMHVVDAKPEYAIEATSGPLKSNASSEDDLALGIEASLYGKQGLRTVQEYLRSTRSHPVFSRWNSLTSAISAQSAPLSVMDVLNLWTDDPEEVLLDLGFGCDEPDISGRIPARFINNQSSARGINIQVFLDAQKNRMDIENPDVSNRFRQLEVLQQVTTAFSSLVGVSSKDSCVESGAPALLSAEARERRKRMGMLLRRASKKTLSQNQLQTKNQTEAQLQTQNQTQDCAIPPPQTSLVQPHEIPAGLSDRRTPLKRARHSLSESCLSSLLEEQGPASEASAPTLVSQKSQDGPLRLRLWREPLPMMTSGVTARKKMPPEAKESFEMEEIQSFDEGSVSGSYTGVFNNTAVCVMRTNSVQSDSSGFLEEPLIPSLIHHLSSGPELMKALTCLSGSSTESQITVTEESLDPPSPIKHTSCSTPLTPPLVSLDPSLSLDPSSSSLDPSSPSLDPSSSSLDPSSPSLDQSSPSLDPSSPSLDQSSPSLDPSFPSLDQSSSSLDPSSSSLDPSSPSLDPSSSSLDPSSSSLDPSSSSIDPSSPSLDPFPPSLNPSSPSINPSSSSLDPSSPSLDPSSPSLDPSSPSINTLSHSLPIFFPKCTLDRAETTGPTPRLSQLSTYHDHLEMTNGCLGAKPSLMEQTVTEEDGFSSQYGAPCHKPDSLSRHLVIIMKTETETEQSEVVSEEAVLTRGKKNDGENQSDSVQTETECVGDQDTETDSVGDQDTGSSGSHEGSSMDSVILINTRLKMEMETDNENSLGSDGQWLAFVVIPQRIDQRSECGSVQDQLSEDPLLGPDCKPSEPAHPDLSTDPSLASCPSPVHWTTASSETSEAPSSFSVQATVPPADQQIDPSTDSLTDIPTSQSSEQLSSLSSSLASASPAVSSSLPNKALSPVPHVPAAQFFTYPSQTSAPVVPQRGALRSGRSVSVQMPSCLSSISCSALRSSELPHNITPVSPSVESCLLTRRSSFSRKAWSDADTCHFSEPQNTAVSMERARVTPETVSLQSPCLSPPLSASSQGLPRDRSRRPVRSCMKSPSLDANLWQEDEGQEVYDEEEDGRWERALFSELSCPCSCHNLCGCCSQNNRLKDTSASAFPFSQDELEGMMRCMRKFRCVLTGIEEQLSDNQALVYSSLSDTDREEAKEILELRRAVKQEAGVLEQQLTELAHHYDDNFKMKMHRLLDEQSALYTQLRLSTLTPVTSPGLSLASSKNVATQCCLLPWLPLKDMSDSISIGQMLEHGLSDTKPDKLDFVGFIQRLKESLRHSGNAESVD